MCTGNQYTDVLLLHRLIKGFINTGESELWVPERLSCLWSLFSGRLFKRLSLYETTAESHRAPDVSLSGHVTSCDITEAYSRRAVQAAAAAAVFF